MIYTFIHGLGQDSSSWDKMLSFIIKPNPHVLLDLNKLIDNGSLTYDNLYKSFKNYCNNFSEPLNLCGLSLGGVLALNYTIDYPEKVESLVLIGTQYKMPKNLLKLQNIIYNFMPNVLFKNMGFKKEDCIELTSSMIDLDFTKDLKNISCSTIIICGTKDYANKKVSKSLYKNISNSKLYFIEKASHEVNIQNPEQLAQILKL